MSAGYSGTPLVRKLGVKENWRVALLGAPDGFEAELVPMPPGVAVTFRLGPSGRERRRGAEIDLALLFTRSRADLDRRFPQVASRLQPAGSLWVAWPKRSSGWPTDLTENVVRDVGLAHGMVDNKVCAISEVWSGLRFVLRLADRPGR